MIKSIIHRFKRKSKGKTLLTTELIEQKALERVMPLAQGKTTVEICQDCRDQRCLTGSECKAFDLLSKTYAWEMIVRNAELN
ncbi:hypothetical protein ES707_07801 [subsurface metagenome]